MSGETVHLDLRGLKCPLPALRTRAALARASAGTLITVECTDPMAAIDIPHLAHETGHVLEEQRQSGNVLCFALRVRRLGVTAAPDAVSAKQ